ncbi:hypothetical protein [Dyadobacter sp.]|uniref:hypothetical protein n=1 Tax=Dyadobacter sp. TaxID=1914288 RepID=UPI003F6FAD7C
MQLIVKDDKLQKYRDHIQTGTDLTGKDKALFDRYFFAFTLLLDGFSERKVVESLMFSPAPVGQLSQSQAYNVVNGCQQIFGSLDFGNAKKIAQREIYATRLEEMAHTMQQMGKEMLTKNSVQIELSDGTIKEQIDIDTQKEAAAIFGRASEALMKSAKIRGLMEKDQLENPNKYKVAPNIIFTDDLASLEMYREIEDSIYEDVTGNETEAGQSQADAGSQEG